MKTTFSRTFTAAAVVLLAATLLIGISFQMLVKDYLVRQTMDGLRKDGECIAELVLAYGAEEYMTGRDFHIALSTATRVSGADAVICDATGRLALCADAPLGCQHTGLMLEKSYLDKTFAENGCSSTGIIGGLYEDTRYVVSVPIRTETGTAVGIVIVSSPLDSATMVLERISEIFVFVSVLTVIVAVLVTIIFARRQAAPLRDMAKTARAFGHGELTARVATDGNNPEEVEELARAFNNMASSLQKSEYRRQEFVANVSHELKTPMTTISGYVDGILDGTIPPEKSRQYLTLVSEETKRLSRLVRSMLDISRLQDQGGITEEQKSRFDVLECAGQVLISFEQKINSKKLDVQVEMPEHPVFTFAQNDAITQVIYNLVDNAVKFCPEGGALSLRVTQGRDKVYLTVSNDGEVIPPEELPLVFDRFHKMDKSRARNRDSWGLGLYIVRTLIDSHGENISVTSRDGKTAFTFTLPLVN